MVFISEDDAERKEYFRKLLEEEIEKMPHIPYGSEKKLLKRVWDNPEFQQPVHEAKYLLVVLIAERRRKLEWLKRGKFCADQTKADCVADLRFIEGEIKALMWLILGDEVRV